MTASPAQRPQRDRWLRYDQVADILNVHAKTVYRMATIDGCFVAAKIRGSVRILESSVHAYLDRQVSLFALENGTDADSK